MNPAAPLFSVVIPTCGRNVQLREALLRLRPGAQTLPASDYEIIVTDDSAACEASSLSADFPRVRFARGPGRGPAANRNAGARLARGEWIAFLDDDCLPSPGWLEALAEFARAGFALIEGRTLCTGGRDTPFEEQIENLGGGVFWSCNLAVNRDAFLALGGFDEDFTEPCMEDVEFAWRAKSLRSIFAKNAAVEHPARRVNLGQLWRRALMARWHSLFKLKTGQSPAVEAALPFVLVHFARNQIMDLLRTSWQAVARPPHQRRKRALALQAWRVATFPAVFVYCALWELRFRRMLARRGRMDRVRSEQPKAAPALVR